MYYVIVVGSRCVPTTAIIVNIPIIMTEREIIELVARALKQRTLRGVLGVLQVKDEMSYIIQDALSSGVIPIIMNGCKAVAIGNSPSTQVTVYNVPVLDLGSIM